MEEEKSGRKKFIKRMNWWLWKSSKRSNEHIRSGLVVSEQRQWPIKCAASS